ncbi:hypothetical protein NHF50_09060 [Flavobacterium sp. NRK F10]|uniref:hypothetical protein n=1 Tax=Flavobacterium TaxID=237 RepID=UPI001475CB3F|nr:MULTISPECIES: hypothetical protein [Flavobacterium]MCO6175197.1 hypothetical protein [Flavobacterium sp. NRK F10]
MKHCIKIVSLVMIIGMTLVSCGPRRYKCGPYRKCEVKEQKSENTPILILTKENKANC